MSLHGIWISDGVEWRLSENKGKTDQNSVSKEEIDELIENMSNIVARGINMSL